MSDTHRERVAPRKRTQVAPGVTSVTVVGDAPLDGLGLAVAVHWQKKQLECHTTVAHAVAKAVACADLKLPRHADDGGVQLLG